MNAQFKAKLIQHLSNKKKDQGFTLIELLVVVIIVGILAAVALPNLLGQVGKARETEGKNGIGTINRAQQSYHFERQEFSNAIDNGTDSGELGNQDNLLGITVASDYYNFAVEDGDENFVTALAEAVDGSNDGVRAYSGGTQFGSGVYDLIICQTDAINALPTAPTEGDIPANIACEDDHSELR